MLWHRGRTKTLNVMHTSFMTLSEESSSESFRGRTRVSESCSVVAERSAVSAAVARVSSLVASLIGTKSSTTSGTAYCESLGVSSTLLRRSGATIGFDVAPPSGAWKVCFAPLLIAHPFFGKYFWSELSACDAESLSINGTWRLERGASTDNLNGGFHTRRSNN